MNIHYDAEEYTIGKVASLCGISVETIRYYEKSGLISAQPRLDNNYRTFSHATLERLLFILKTKKCGFTLNEIKKILSIADSEISLNDKNQITEIIHRKISDLNKMLEQICEIKNTLEETIGIINNEITKECSSIDFLFRKK